MRVYLVFFLFFLSSKNPGNVTQARCLRLYIIYSAISALIDQSSLRAQLRSSAPFHVSAQQTGSPRRLACSPCVCPGPKCSVAPIREQQPPAVVHWSETSRLVRWPPNCRFVSVG